MNNHTINSLHAKSNDITVDGTITILKVAVANGICQDSRGDH